MKKIIPFIGVCLSLLISCRKQIKPEVVIIKTETPMREVKTDSITGQDTLDSTSLLQITDTAAVFSMKEMWEERFGNRNFKGMIQELKTEKDPSRREDLIFELGHSYDTIAIQPIIEILKKDKWAPVRYYAAEALGNLGAVHGPEFVKREFGEDRLKALLTFKEKRIIPALKSALYDKDIAVVYCAASELVALGDTGYTTLKILLDIFRKKNITKWKIQHIPRPDIPAEDQPKFKEDQKRAEASLPTRALDVLKRVRNKFVIDGLTDALKDKDSWVREKARQTLEELKEGEVK